MDFQGRAQGVENARPRERRARGDDGRPLSRLPRVFFSRRNLLCSFCQQPLPEELLFTPAEVAAIEAAERERAQAAERRNREREAARRNAVGGGDGTGF